MPRRRLDPPDVLLEQEPLAAAVATVGTTAFEASPDAGVAAASSTMRMWRLEDFELGGWLGSGTYGHVQLVRERDSKTVAALKILKKRRLERFRAQRHIAREIEIQRHLQHTGVLRLFGFFWDATYIYMILEHASGGDLEQKLKQVPGGCLEEVGAASLARQIASAVAYCHQLHVIHRDLKPQNILFSGQMAKLADFGWAVHASPAEARRTLCGTLDYLSPEMVQNCGHSFEVDAWGVGVLTYESLLGKPPFSAPTHDETCRLILAAALELPHSLSDAARHFLVQLLQRAPANRMQLGEATAHPWTSLVAGGRAAMAGA